MTIRRQIIDIHTHILPHMDDGAAGVEEAITMTDLLYEQGVAGAVCTPHFDPGKMALQNFINRRAAAMALMGASKIILFPASETLFHEYLFHYPDLSGLYMGATRYLLLELPFDKKWDGALFQKIEKLMVFYDCIPIIAHIERYPAASERNIKQLINQGCLLQMNTSALIDRSMQKKALRLIRQDKIDLLGSDCHNRRVRPPILAPAYDIIRDRVGKEYSERLKENSVAVMKDIDIRYRRKESF